MCRETLTDRNIQYTMGSAKLTHVAAQNALVRMRVWHTAARATVRRSTILRLFKDYASMCFVERTYLHMFAPGMKRQAHVHESQPLYEQVFAAKSSNSGGKESAT